MFVCVLNDIGDPDRGLGMKALYIAWPYLAVPERLPVLAHTLLLQSEARFF